MSNLTHWKKFFPSDYVSAGDFEHNEKKIVTIERTSRDQVVGQNNKKDTCLIVHFNQKNVKPLVCNVTNSKAISRVAKTPHIEEWVGTTIELYVKDGIKAFGETVEAVRVSSIAPKPKQKPILTPESNKWTDGIQKLANGETNMGTIEKYYTISNQHKSDFINAANKLKENANA